MNLDTLKIDICLISETHFTSESYIQLKGYKVYHTVHPFNTARGRKFCSNKTKYVTLWRYTNKDRQNTSYI